MLQLILHLLGDYVTQSDWMANNKTKRTWPALCHAIVYSLPFLILKPSWSALAVIFTTHFLIDRFRLTRYLVWFKNVIGNADTYRHGWPSEIVADEMGGAFGKTFSDLLKVKGFSGDQSQRSHHAKWCWSNCSATGYPDGNPTWLSVWLLIAADNTLHLAINYAALRWL